MKRDEYGKVWFNQQFRLFKEYDAISYVRIRLGSKWEYVNINDVAKWPKNKSE